MAESTSPKTLAECISHHRRAVRSLDAALKEGEAEFDRACDIEAASLQAVLVFPCASTEDVRTKARYLGRAFGPHDQLDASALGRLLKSFASVGD